MLTDAFVLIVEDHPLVADSLHACIRTCDATINIEIAETLRAALLILARHPGLPAPALITTDLTLPDSSGIESVRRLREAAPTSPLLVFTALDAPSLRHEAQALDVIGYLLKSASASTLCSKIKETLGDRIHQSQGAPVTPAPSDQTIPLLTIKQQTVMQELVAGRSNREIATRMNISPETVASHIKEVFNRLSVRNRTEAVVRYLAIVAQQPPRKRR